MESPLEELVPAAETPGFEKVLVNRELLAGLSFDVLSKYRMRATQQLNQLHMARVLMSGYACLLLSKKSRFLPGEASLIGLITEIDSILRR